MEDTYEAKSGRMIIYLRKVRDLLKKFVLVQVRHVPIAENSRVDALAKLATALQEDLSKSTPVEYLVEPSIDLCNVEIAHVGSEPSWTDPIWDYIIDRHLLDDPKEAAKVRQGLPGLPITREASTSDDSSHLSLSASREKTLNTC